MAAPQFSIRIPPSLDERLKVYTTSNNTTRTEVVVAALAQYLGCIEDIPLPQRVLELEERLALVENIIQSRLGTDGRVK